jgi:hypothetical protein
VVSVTPRTCFTPGKGPPVPIGEETVWASKLVWTQRLEEKSFVPARDRTPVPTIKEIKSKRLEGVGHVALAGQIRNIQKFSEKTWRKETTWKKQGGLDGSIILKKWVF